MKRFLALTTIAMLALGQAHAVIRITKFTNDSDVRFERIHKRDRVVGEEGLVISSLNGRNRIVLEDGDRSGFHRPHWKFHVFLERDRGFPGIAGNRIHYATFFYDGEGEMQLHIDDEAKLHVMGGRDVLYPWQEAVQGRGCPYHNVDHDPYDDNGVAYFDAEGFVNHGDRAQYVDADDYHHGCGGCGCGGGHCPPPWAWRD